MNEIKITYELSDKSYVKWRQIINSVHKTWKKLLKENQSQSDSSNLVLLDHQLLKNNRTLGIEKMNSKEIYSIIIPSKLIYQYLELILKKKFLSIIFNGTTYTHFRIKSLQMPT